MPILALSHVVKFLGFVVDTLNGVFHLTAKQKQKLRDVLSSCLAQPSKVQAKLLARATDLITSMSLVTGSLSDMFSQYLQRARNTCLSW